MKKLFYLSLVLLIFAGCKNDMKVVKGKNFFIKLPVGAENFTGQMLENSLLEFGDTAKHVYFIVEEKKTTKAISLDSARESFVDYNLKEDVIDSDYTVKPLGKNGQMIEAETITLNPADMSSFQTYWVVGIYQHSPKDYYIVWTWTDRLYKPDNEKLLKSVVKSFKLKKK